MKLLPVQMKSFLLGAVFRITQNIDSIDRDPEEYQNAWVF